MHAKGLRRPAECGRGKVVLPCTDFRNAACFFKPFFGLSQRSFNLSPLHIAAISVNKLADDRSQRLQKANIIRGVTLRTIGQCNQSDHPVAAQQRYSQIVT